MRIVLQGLERRCFISQRKGKSVHQRSRSLVYKSNILLLMRVNNFQLDDASERDKRRLTDELHIATVIDLRSTYVLFFCYSPFTSPLQMYHSYPTCILHHIIICNMTNHGK